MSRGVRIGTALLPLALVPLLTDAIARGSLDLGGGEKDLVWVLPWTLWSLLFAVTASPLKSSIVLGSALRL